MNRHSDKSDKANQTIDYYNRNAERFFLESLDIDMSEIYKMFLELIPSGGKILDAGCGSGRDSLYFIQNGFEVVAFDASFKLAEMASKLIGQEVLNLRFQELNRFEEFDGIWACASLLHISRAEMDDVLRRLIAALKIEGTLYVLFKYGDKEIVDNGRFFNYYNEDSFSELLSKHPAVEVIKCRVDDDTRPGKENQKWLNVLAEGMAMTV